RRVAGQGRREAVLGVARRMFRRQIHGSALYVLHHSGRGLPAHERAPSVRVPAPEVASRGPIAAAGPLPPSRLGGCAPMCLERSALGSGNGLGDETRARSIDSRPGGTRSKQIPPGGVVSNRGHPIFGTRPLGSSDTPSAGTPDRIQSRGARSRVAGEPAWD